MARKSWYPLYGVRTQEGVKGVNIGGRGFQPLRQVMKWLRTSTPTQEFKVGKGGDSSGLGGQWHMILFRQKW